MAIKLIIAGIAGRMGGRLLELASRDPAFEVVYGLEAPSTVAALPGLPIGSDKSFIQKGDVVLDFTVADATVALLPEVVRYRKAMVIGTTGFSAEQEAKMTQAAKEIPIVVSFNMSLGVNVFFKAAQEVAKALPGYAVHIQETHHTKKKDAPSGTALQAGRLIEKVSKQKVTYESFREGDVVGDHRIIFKGPSDRLELLHHAESRDIFATGALQAAKWVAGKAPGLYSMRDVLGL
jgi:4-hydroxy-tetrahydrodipicolinate reductase